MKLTMRGVKANDRSIDLEKLNLFTGPNGTGKTTTTDSIRFLALGFVPALGKRPLDTSALMSDSTMEVELTTDDGRTMRSAIAKTGASFQQSAETSWLKNSKPTEIGKEILRQFGDEEVDVREALDIRELLNATPNERASRIEQLLESGKRPAAETTAAVSRFTLMRLVPKLDEKNVPENHLDLLPLITKSHKATLRENAAMLESKIAEAGIAGAMEWANEEKRSHSTGLKQKQEAAHQMRLRAVEVPEPDEREIAKLTQERDSLQQDLGGLLEKGRAYTEKSSTRRRIEEATNDAKRTMDTTAAALADFEKGDGKEISALQKKGEKAIERMASLKTPQADPAPQVGILDKEIQDLKSELDGIELPEIPETHEQLYALKHVEDQIKRAKDSPWSEVLAIALEFKKLDKQKARASRLEKLAREGLNGADVEALEHEQERCKKALEDAVRTSERVRAERDGLLVRRNEIECSCDEKTAQMNRARSKANEAHIKALADFDAEKRKILAERQETERKLAELRTRHESLKAAQRSAESRYQSLYAQLNGMGDVPPAPKSTDDLVKKLESTKAQLDKLIDARATHAEIHRAIAAVEEAESARDVFAAIEWALQRQREVEIAEAGGPLKKFMGKFLEAAGRKERPFIEAGVGGIGWITADEARVQVQTLSGGEWALFTSALTAAVLLCRKAELKMLLIEAGETDQNTLAQVLRGVRAVSKGLTAAIVLTPHAPADGAEGWNVVNMSSEPVAA